MQFYRPISNRTPAGFDGVFSVAVRGNVEVLSISLLMAAHWAVWTSLVFLAGFQLEKSQAPRHSPCLGPT